MIYKCGNEKCKWTGENPSIQLLHDENFEHEYIELCPKCGKQTLHKEGQIRIDIDVNSDFDGLDLEDAIEESKGKAKEILIIIHKKWSAAIGEPEWSDKYK